MAGNGVAERNAKAAQVAVKLANERFGLKYGMAIMAEAFGLTAGQAERAVFHAQHREIDKLEKFLKEVRNKK
jgi:hypothetical protein